jgi:hypothetical protein
MNYLFCLFEKQNQKPAKSSNKLIKGGVVREKSTSLLREAISITFYIDLLHILLSALNQPFRTSKSQPPKRWVFKTAFQFKEQELQDVKKTAHFRLKAASYR